MPTPVTNLTALSAKDIHSLQPAKSKSWAQRQYQSIRDAYKSSIVAVKHVADFWSLPESDIITQLAPRFSL
jgi:hypothetical protein